MLSLDEAIIQEAETAHEKLTDYLLRRTNDEAYNTAEVNDLEKEGEYHRQLTGWLKGYKRLKEKETPKMVIYSGDGYADGELVYDMAECPNCGMNFEESDSDWEEPYCHACGQALRWEVEE